MASLDHLAQMLDRLREEQLQQGVYIRELAKAVRALAAAQKKTPAPPTSPSPFAIGELPVMKLAAAVAVGIYMLKGGDAGTALGFLMKLAGP